MVRPFTHSLPARALILLFHPQEIDQRVDNGRSPEPDPGSDVPTGNAQPLIPNNPCPLRRFRVTVEEVVDEDEDEGGEDDDAPDPGSDFDREQNEQAPREPSASPEPELPEHEVPLGTPEPEPVIDNPIKPVLKDLQLNMEFIELLKTASLADSGLDPDVLHRILNPPQYPLEIDDPDVLYSIDLFFATLNASEETYEDARQAYIRRHPHDKDKILSYHNVRKKIEELSGVVPHIEHQCIRSCMAYTGPLKLLKECPHCKTPRYKPSTSGKEVPRQEFFTILLGFQLNALRRSKEGATASRYLWEATKRTLAELGISDGVIQVFEDLCHSEEYLEAVDDKRIGPHDSVLQLSIDGAQLYEKKQSDCWIYIWVLYTLDPKTRYKKAHILPGGIIRGPEKPKNLESFLFPGLYHLSALMNDGLPFWDAVDNKVYVDHPFLAWVTADGPAMAQMNGLVGHHGARACRLWCPMPGRRKEGCPHYYPVLLKPNAYTVDGCDHADIPSHALPRPDIEEYQDALRKVCESRTNAEYERNRKKYGIVKPSLFSGLPRIFALPHCFPLDIMHLGALNIPDLYLSLWRGTMDGNPDDKKTWDFAIFAGKTEGADRWKFHGEEVVLSNPFLPGSFDRPPRNIAEKISSGYKAWEFLTYFYNLSPAYLRHVLPRKYWLQHCKSVSGFLLVHGWSVRAEDIQQAHVLLNEAAIEFEEIYCQRQADRLHFVRPCLHTSGHAAEEIPRTGPLSTNSQWVIERAIGDFGGEIRQHSNPYANLSQRAVIRSQINALRAMLPNVFKSDLGTAHNKLPRGSINLGDGYALLRARARTAYHVPPAEAEAFTSFLTKEGVLGVGETFTDKVRKWARVRLPNTQIARSAWKETLKPLNKLRMSRNVKVWWTVTIYLSSTNIAYQFCDGQVPSIGEVQYFCQIDVGEDTRTVALVSVWGSPDAALLQDSYGAVYMSKYRGDAALRVIDVTAITSVVAMVPDVHRPRTDATPQLILDDAYFLAERVGLDVMRLGRDTLEVITEE
ncbi:uncharacterized protein TRAVEDRAFT_136440 [Trametes versicolor FP-101664 SS1]|uniref:Uncharacterized protein n=1 Tax=Trametes versicolor (strain FP-101664) TaxID=717944 RepID=R7SAE4_TRAVS|nr:uncharacterized protein TRAVEDRAFT_136440 [Trametes versicolor FP-101664 SS1]EIW51939.1 hypothetical protein TRAVEDRAFT_136440 [Trametes versicolor FP-101664 SS1]